MATSVFSSRLEHRTRAFENIAEQWKRDHDNAMFACDVEELVDECLDQYDFLREGWECALQWAVDDGIASLDELGNLLLAVFDRTLVKFGETEHDLEKARELQYSVSHEREFSRAFIEMKKIRHRIKKSWPFTDVKGMDDALKAFREGRTRNVQDIINDLQRPNS